MWRFAVGVVATEGKGERAGKGSMFGGPVMVCDNAERPRLVSAGSGSPIFPVF